MKCNFTKLNRWFCRYFVDILFPGTFLGHYCNIFSGLEILLFWFLGLMREIENPWWKIRSKHFQTHKLQLSIVSHKILCPVIDTYVTQQFSRMWDLTAPTHIHTIIIIKFCFFVLLLGVCSRKIKVTSQLVLVIFVIFKSSYRVWGCICGNFQFWEFSGNWK